MYHKLDIDGNIPLEGDTEIVAGIGSIVLGPRTPLVKPYFIGGAGFYRLDFSARSVFGRFDDTEEEFGWNASGGISFGIGRINLFVEARYHSVNTEGERFTFVPVSVGLVF